MIIIMFSFRELIIKTTIVFLKHNIKGVYVIIYKTTIIIIIIIVEIKAQNYILGLELGRRRWLVQERINSNEVVKLKVPWVCSKWKCWERWSEEEYLLESAKYKPNVFPIVQSDIPGNSTDRDVHYEHTRRMEARKYLRKGCCHRIKCSIANFLAALMWRRLLNSAVLATPTHRGPEGVSNGTSTQVVA